MGTLMHRTDEVFAARVPKEVDCATMNGLTGDHLESKFPIGNMQRWFGRVNTVHGQYLSASVRIECSSNQVEQVVSMVYQIVVMHKSTNAVPLQ